MSSDESRLVSIVGPVFLLEDVMRMLGMSEEQVIQEVKENRILALDTADEHLVFPEWQFKEGKSLPHLEEVLTPLREVMSAWGAVLWMSGKTPELEDLSAKEWLLAEKPITKVSQQARRTANRWKQ